MRGAKTSPTAEWKTIREGKEQKQKDNLVGYCYCLSEKLEWLRQKWMNLNVFWSYKHVICR